MSDKQASQNSENAGQWEPGSERFYLPDICTPQSLLFMILAGGLLSFMFSILSYGITGFEWHKFALIVIFVLWIILICTGILCRMRDWLTKLSLIQGLIVSYGTIVLITGAISLLSNWALKMFVGYEFEEGGWLVVQHVLITAILAGVALRYLYLQEQLHIQQQAELASRIQALQSRIRPHFLFNSMNIIASLIDSDPQLAEEVVEDLSELFRSSLTDVSNLVPVSKEAELAQSYIHIEQLRLGDRLQVNWDLDEFGSTVMIPHLSLQPLLENAIYHGIQPLAQGGVIDVVIKQDGDNIRVKVSNPFPGNVKQSRHKGNKMALENLQRRLHAYYSDRATFEVMHDNGIFTVSFSYPLISQTDEK